MNQEREARPEEQADEEARRAVQRSLDWQDHGGDSK
jgi:hypothetical protein